jgi:hypothetical protein
MRDEYKYQHYVPRVHLKRFSIDSSTTRVWCFDKPLEKSFPRSVSETAGEEFFYDSKDKEVPEVERYLSSLEKNVGHPYKVIGDTKSLDCLTPQDRRYLAQFLAAQFYRTRERRNSIRDVGELVQEALSERFGIELPLGDDEAIEQQLREAHSESMNHQIVDKIADILLEKRWMLLRNLTEENFWTSDHPLVRYNDLDYPEWASSVGLTVDGVRIYFPLTPNLMLVMADPAYFWKEPTHSDINEAKNVLFYNELQIRQSNRQVYASTDNFGLARDTVSRIPETKDPTRERHNRSPFDQ